MFRRTDRTRLDRGLAAIEILALGLWLGALCGFAFIFAPAAFRIVTDLTQFAALTSANLRTLAVAGYVCGGIAIVIAIVRARDAADRTNDIARAGCVFGALCFLAWEMAYVVPEMAATTDYHSDAYHALHGLSTEVYGCAVLFVALALVLAAVRSER
jgi:hypothetical protein